MKTLLPLLVLIFLSLVCVTSTVAEEPKPHVVLVVGTHHYSPELSMPLLAKELERLGFRATVVMGDGDPEKKTEHVLPGIEALADADAAIFFMRFLKLPDEEWQPVEDYLKSGKPVIGLRTANHSFKYDKGHPRYEWNDGFGRRALGTPYIVHQTGTTQVSVVAKTLSHPIMSGVTKKTWESEGTLYLTRLEGGCVPLVTGTGKGKTRLLEKDFGVILVNESEADIIAWAWQNEWGGKVFSTTFGHPADFAEESFTRMLVNSVCWAVDKPLPAADEPITTWNIERADKKPKPMRSHEIVPHLHCLGRRHAGRLCPTILSRRSSHSRGRPYRDRRQHVCRSVPRSRLSGNLAAATLTGGPRFNSQPWMGRRHADGSGPPHEFSHGRCNVDCASNRRDRCMFRNGRIVCR